MGPATSERRLDLPAKEGSRGGWCSDQGQTRPNPPQPAPNPSNRLSGISPLRGSGRPRR